MLQYSRSNIPSISLCCLQADDVHEYQKEIEEYIEVLDADQKVAAGGWR